MITLHEVLYITDPDLKIRVVVHGSTESTKDQGVKVTEDMIYEGEAGDILRKLIRDRSEFLNYYVNLSVFSESGDASDKIVQIDAMKAKTLNTFDVLYATQDGLKHTTIKAENYSLASKKFASGVYPPCKMKFWLKLTNGIG